MELCLTLSIVKKFQPIFKKNMQSLILIHIKTEAHKWIDMLFSRCQPLQKRQLPKMQHFSRTASKRQFLTKTIKRLRQYIIITIMENQQQQQINLIGATPLTSQRHHPHTSGHQYGKEHYFTQDNDKWIQHFLSPSALVTETLVNSKQQQNSKEVCTIENFSELKENSVSQKQSTKRQRSIFHNFQKHLITLLKKISLIKRRDMFNQRAGFRALSLWKIFKERRDFSKKSLYLAFGILNSSNDTFITRISQDIPQLQKMLKKYGLEEIECAQRLLRRLVLEKVSKISKQIVQQQCKMAKFEEFYSYFLHFIEELEGEGICKRLPKQEKLKVVLAKV